jgi:regulator of cell morphogenesis and NO signaling
MGVLQRAVGELAADHPSWSRVFEELGIDYCCGGRVTLAEACRKGNLDPAAVLERLRAADAPDAEDGPAPEALSLGALCDHIVDTHHAYLRRELPRIAALLRKVVTAHGARRPELARVEEIFSPFAAEMMLHLLKEEQILFPLIRRLETAGRPPEFHCGGVQNPVAVMEAEHDQAGEALKQMRVLTGNYTPPAEACTTYRALLHALSELEQDLHRHVHKENNILFPRACEMDRRMTSPVA